MKVKPLITIYLTNYNYGKYLTRSITSAKNQIYKNIEIIVIGKPLKLNNEIHDLEEEIVKFIKSLKNYLPNIQVERIDERFTSKISKKIIIKSGVGKKNRRDKLIIDKISASLILESYLIQKNK